MVTVNQLVSGRYRIKSLIGSGGMANLFLLVLARVLSMQKNRKRVQDYGEGRCRQVQFL